MDCLLFALCQSLSTTLAKLTIAIFCYGPPAE